MSIDITRHLLNLSKQKEIARDYKKIGDWASDKQSKASIGGTVGGLLGQFGVPKLAALLASAAPALSFLGGPTGLLLSSILGAGLSSYVGSKVNTEDAPDVQRGKAELSTLKKQLKEIPTANLLMSGAGAGSGALTMGADKYLKFIDNPLSYIMQGVGKDKGTSSILDIVKEADSAKKLAMVPDIVGKDIAGRVPMPRIPGVDVSAEFDDLLLKQEAQNVLGPASEIFSDKELLDLPKQIQQIRDTQNLYNLPIEEQIDFGGLLNYATPSSTGYGRNIR